MTSIILLPVILRAEIIDSVSSQMYNPLCNRRYVVSSSEPHHLRARSSAAERPAHNRLIAGSNPAEPTFEVTYPQQSIDFSQKAPVLLEATELLQLRELLFILRDNKGRRHLELRQKPNGELCALYEGVSRVVRGKT